MTEAARAVGAGSRKRDVLTLALVILALLAITIGDNIVYPGHNLTILYVIPVLAVALRATPREVLGVAVASLLLDGYESLLHDDVYHGWPIRTAALVVVYGFAVLIASQRKQLAARSGALEVANARANGILDNAANAILFVEPGRDQLTANATARRLFAGATDREFGIAAAMGELTLPDGSPLTPAEWPS
ncbi:MAG TPA: hypothetical protein VFZ25_19620, partial [Chloroflexota bacterium]|nr:hypothetical protein [Chloroflexota bacterium]